MDTRTADISQFLHSKDTKSFCADMSDIGVRAADKRPRYVQINNRARLTCATFELVSHQEDREGDIMLWVYVPTDETLAEHPKLRGYQLELFND